MSDINKFLNRNTILTVYRGSIAYGTNHAKSDVDIGGICVPPKDYIYGLNAFEQHENKNYINYPGFSKTGQPADAVIYSLQKFVRLASNCNPNIIEMMFVDPQHIAFCNELGQILLDQRALFLTKRAKNTFGGYAFSQLRKLDNKLPADTLCNKLNNTTEKVQKLQVHGVRIKHRIQQLYLQAELGPDAIKEIIESEETLRKNLARIDTLNEELLEFNNALGGGNHNHHGSHSGLIEEYGYDVKHAMHLIRLLKMGLEILATGECNVLRPDNQYLLAIRHGEFTLEQIQTESKKLFGLLDEAYATSKLPNSPDLGKINQLLIDITEASLRQ